MALIKLTDYNTKKPILIGTEQIIEVKESITRPLNGEPYISTEIRSVGGMVTTNDVVETVEEIYKMVNKK